MIKPNLLQGFRDYLPPQMQLRQHVIDKVRRVYASFGFEPLDTPVLEKAELLMGKYGEDEKLIYHFRDHGNREVAMRYDLTVPLARVATSYPDLPKPFKRYQVGPVWRADSPQRGRYREFMQCDVDTVGTKSPLADAEMLLVMDAVMQALHLPKYRIRLNHRAVFSALLDSLDISATDQKQVLRYVDKMDKIGTAAVRTELAKSVDKRALDKLFALFAIEDSEQLLAAIREQLAGNTHGLEAVENLSSIYTLSQDGGAKCIIDLSVIRGLDYYTGVIYEMVLEDDSDIGTIYGGGRYDALMRELAGVDMPAVGTSLGVDRLLAAVSPELGQVSSPVVVTVFVGMESQAQQLAQNLRQHGLAVVLAFGQDKLGKQLQYADSIGSKQVLLYGEDEQKRGVVNIRNMQSGEQTEHPIEPLIDLVAFLKKLV